MVNEVPNSDISAIAADPLQVNTWYVTSRANLFQSRDNGESWEVLNRFPDDEETVLIHVNKLKPGQLAVITNLMSDIGSKVYLSDDNGATWRTLVSLAFTINDLAWTMRENEPFIIMATDKGLFELGQQPGASPVQIVVNRNRPTLRFTAVATAAGVRGTAYVAAAAGSISGASVFLSSSGGKSGSYDPLELSDEYVRSLAIEQNGPRTFLWAGLAVKIGSEAGKGAVRWELQAGSAGTQTFMTRGWVGGSCHRLAFSAPYAFAATHDRGVLWLNLNLGDHASWHGPLKESGLKLHDDLSFQPVTALAAAAQPVSPETTEPGPGIVMAGGLTGVYLSTDDGTSYVSCSEKAFHAKP